MPPLHPSSSPPSPIGSWRNKRQPLPVDAAARKRVIVKYLCVVRSKSGTLLILNCTLQPPPATAGILSCEFPTLCRGTRVYNFQVPSSVKAFMRACLTWAGCHSMVTVSSGVFPYVVTAPLTCASCRIGCPPFACSVFVLLLTCFLYFVHFISISIFCMHSLSCSLFGLFLFCPSPAHESGFLLSHR